MSNWLIQHAQNELESMPDIDLYLRVRSIVSTDKNVNKYTAGSLLKRLNG